ncbi:MAG: bifunctional demethylmenaquinone methyltransferase/2-methoxy-6-polyprenyl-1,4-benzoquinol methylase UbiE [Planctomycetota bacterium]
MTDDVRPGSGEMFDAIARRYDLLNRLMSFGMDISWRRKAVRALLLKDATAPRVLDVATGTGDVAIEVARQLKAATIDGIDPSANMLEIARRKATAKQLDSRLTFHQGDAQKLPFDDASYDGALIAFGIRNVPDRLQGLREMRRVVRPGHRVVVLELTEPRRGLLSRAARLYIHGVVPRMGALLSGRREYRYLQQSIAAFPPPAEFAQMMTDAGLIDVTWRLLGFGTVGLHSGVVPR